MANLPSNPDITLLKKQAKKLLKQFRTKAPDALALIQTHFPKSKPFSTLRDAQLVIAREYGFANWPKLAEAVRIAAWAKNSPAERAFSLIMLGCLQYNGRDNLRTQHHAAQILAAYPDVAEYSFYTSLVANNATAVKRFIGANPEIVNTTGGPLNWPPLLYLTYSRIPSPENTQAAINILQLLLERGADPNAHVLLNNTYCFTALTGVMGEGEAGAHQPPHQFAEEMAKRLLEAGADANDGQGLYNTMFTRSGDKWLKLLTRYGLNAQHKVNWQHGKPSVFNYLLGMAVSDNRVERVKFLLQAGADPNTRNCYDNRPVYTHAVIKGHKEIATLLKGAGAKAHPLSTEDQLRLACVNEDTVEMHALLKRHPGLVQNPALLHDAAERCNPAIYRLLLQAGFDINGQANYGRTLLHHFAYNNNLTEVKYLVSLAAKLDIKDCSHQSTPLGWAMHGGAKEVGDFLMERTENFFDTIVYANIGRAKELLAQNPALAYTHSPKGFTPLHLVGASLNEEPDYETCEAMVDLLLEAGADIKAVNVGGKRRVTPADFFRVNGVEMMVDILEERGG